MSMFDSGGMDGTSPMLDQIASGQSPGGAGSAPYYPQNPLLKYLGFNPLLMMFLSSQMGGLNIEKMGMSPMSGDYGRNTLDIINGAKMWQTNMQVQSQAAKYDRDSWMDTLKGAATAAHLNWEQVRPGAEKFVDTMVSAAPTLGMMFPAEMDLLAGPRGSAGALASQVMMADRYRYDPNTGRTGVNPEGVDATTRMLMESMGAHGIEGFGGGQLGQIYAGMSSRGLVPEVSRQDIQQRFNPKDVDEFMSSPQGASQIESFRAERVLAATDHYTKAIGAVRDIFGEAGETDAPIPKLFAALDAMTAGATSQISPESMNRMVRMTEQVSQSSGFNIDQMLIMQQGAGAYAQQLGLSPVFGVTAAQDAAVFAQVARSMPGAATPAWGALNPEQMAQMDAKMRVNAAASPAAERMAVALRLDDQVHFAANTEAGQYVAALRSAQQTGNYEFEGKDLSLTPERWTQILSAGSPEVTPGLLASMQQQRDVNLGVVQANQLQNIARAGQRQDIMPWITGAAENTLTSQLVQANTGASRNQINTAVQDIIKSGAIGKIWDASPELTHDTAAYDAFINKTLTDAMGSSGLRLGEATGEDLRGSIYQTVESQFHMPGIAVQQMTNSETIRRQARQQVENQMTGSLRSALAPLEEGSVVRRLIGDLQQTGRNGTMSPADVRASLMHVFGGSADMKDIASGLEAPVTELMAQEAAQRKRIEDYQKAAADQKTDPKILASMSDDIQSHEAAIAAGVKKIEDNPLIKDSAKITAAWKARDTDERTALSGGVERSNKNWNKPVTDQDIIGEFTEMQGEEAKIQGMEADKTPDGQKKLKEAMDKFQNLYGKDAVAAFHDIEARHEGIGDVLASAGSGKAADGKPVEVALAEGTTININLTGADGKKQTVQGTVGAASMTASPHSTGGG